MANDQAKPDVFSGFEKPQPRNSENSVPVKITSAVASGRLAFVLFLWLVIALPGALSAQTPGVYQVNTQASHVQIHLYHGGFLGALSDNHLIVLHRFSGAAELSQANSWNAHLQGQTASLTVEDPGASASDRQEVQEMMDGPDQLDVGRYPLMRFRSLSFHPTPQDTVWSVLADVTLHGVTRQEEFPLDYQQAGDRLQIRGEKVLRLRDFNIQPISRAFGAIKVKNEFKISYQIVLERRP